MNYYELSVIFTAIMRPPHISDKAWQRMRRSMQIQHNRMERYRYRTCQKLGARYISNGLSFIA